MLSWIAYVILSTVPGAIVGYAVAKYSAAREERLWQETKAGMRRARRSLSHNPADWGDVEAMTDEHPGHDFQ